MWPHGVPTTGIIIIINHLKGRVYKDNPENLDDLKNNIRRNWESYFKEAN